MTEADSGPGDSQSILAVDQVSKSYRGETVLNEVSLALAADKVTAIVGPSGCGKSTLLKLFNGLVRPDSGKVYVSGQAVNYSQLPELRRRIGYAVQGNGLFPHLSAQDNVALSARVAGWSQEKIEERLQALFALVHLDADLLDRYPHQLSGGQQQRVGLCRAMMLSPSVLLLDEPFAAIDPITRYDIHHQLLEILESEPISIALVTHDMREAMLLADHIVLMGKGKIARHSSREELRDAYPALEAEELLLALLRDGQS